MSDDLFMRRLIQQLAEFQRAMGLTRLRGHLTRGGYDAQDDERSGAEASA
jgi:hypothetical protein